MKITNKKVFDLIREFNDKLTGSYPKNEIRQFVYMLFEHYAGWSKTKIALSYDEFLIEPIAVQFEDALARLVTGEPIQYIIGVTSFNGILYKVDRRVLIPRPETDELCSIIRNDLSDRITSDFTIMDIGTGSGCIAIDLKMSFPDAFVYATDVSPDAISLAKENALTANCNITLWLADILEANSLNNPGMFNLIVSNPPYVTENDKRFMKSNVTGFEPPTALFVPEADPLKFYHAISGFARQHLKSGGRLYFEINERFGLEIREMLLIAGFLQVEVLTDFNGKNRFIRAISG